MHLIYAARHVCIARTLPGNMSVRLSVCPSVTRQHSVDIAELILNFLLSACLTILFFPIPNGIAIFRPDPRGRGMQGV